MFRDEFSGFPTVMYNIFNGTISGGIDFSDFVRSKDLDAQRLRHTVLLSARLAFHICLDKFLMGEVDVPDHQELLDLIKAEDGEWFFGGEEFLWNSAIEKRLPKLERMITKKGVYFMH